MPSCAGLVSCLLVWTLAVVNAGEVVIKLYPMSKSDFDLSHGNILFNAIADAASSYCAPSECNLASSVTFNSVNVFLSGSKDASKSMMITVTINYPSGASLLDSNITNVPAADLEAILGIARDSYHSSTGVYVTYVGSEYYGIPPDDTANKAVIPVAFVVVILAAVVTVLLRKWQSNKERAETLKSRQERRQAKQAGSASIRNTPLETTITTDVSATVTPRTNHTMTTPRSNTINSNNQVSPESYSTAAPVKMMHYSSPTVNEFTMEEKPSKNGLAPLPEAPLPEAPLPEAPLPDTNHILDDKKDTDAQDEEAARKERKRRRKERRREKERLRQQQMEDSLEMYDNQGMDSSVLTESEQAKIPTFKVESGGVA